LAEARKENTESRGRAEKKNYRGFPGIEQKKKSSTPAARAREKEKKGFTKKGLNEGQKKVGVHLKKRLSLPKK